MCEKVNYKTCNTRIDKCMIQFINNLNKGFENQCIKPTYEILACCCGHNKYPMTIIVKNRRGQIFDLISNKQIPRKRRYYVRDNDGYYYVPETVNIKSEIVNKSK